MWRGLEDSLIIKDEEEFCPDCKKKGYLMDVDFQNNKDEEIETKQINNI